MLLTTQDQPADYEIIQTMGLVRGSTIRARHVGKDIMAGLRTLVGGEITEYTKMLAESREQALDRLMAEARGGRDRLRALHHIRRHERRGRAPRLRHGGQAAEAQRVAPAQLRIHTREKVEAQERETAFGCALLNRMRRPRSYPVD